MLESTFNYSSIKKNKKMFILVITHGECLDLCRPGKNTECCYNTHISNDFDMMQITEFESLRVWLSMYDGMHIKKPKSTLGVRQGLATTNCPWQA